MPKIDQVILRSENPDAQRHFYCDVLGMTEFLDGSVGYGGDEAKLLFQKGEGSYAPTPRDLYWKIALGVPNIELAFQQLTEKGVRVGSPKQFGNVGYLAHLTDPEGFTIELIDHWFKDNRQEEPVHDDVLGGGAHFNLLTLRSPNIEITMQSCLDSGMKLLSIQPVESRGFTLYFFAFTSDTTPSSDEYAVENREWLYQRKYTILEIQYHHNQANVSQPNEREAGYAGTVLSDSNRNLHIKELMISTKF